MGQEDVNQLPVMSGGKFEGMVGRRHILQLLQARAELNQPSPAGTARGNRTSHASGAGD